MGAPGRCRSVWLLPPRLRVTILHPDTQHDRAPDVSPWDEAGAPGRPERYPPSHSTGESQGGRRQDSEARPPTQMGPRVFRDRQSQRGWTEAAVHDPHPWGQRNTGKRRLPCRGLAAPRGLKQGPAWLDSSSRDML